MNRFCLSMLLTALILVAPLAVFVAPEGAYLIDERRRPAEFPDWPEKIRSRSVKNFFRGIEAFWADHFPGRATLLALAANLHITTGLADMDKCYPGRENWLFLGDSYGLGVSKLCGDVFLAPDALKRQTVRYKKMDEAARAVGAEFAIFIGPNKSSVYPEYLPPVIIPAPERFVTPLVASLQQKGLKVYDPTDHLKRRKDKGLFYYRAGTHWNALGAYEAFAGFLDYMGLPPLPPLTLTASQDLAIGNNELVDMCGYVDFPLTTGDSFELNWQVPLEWRNEGGNYLNAQATTDKSVWLFGDSFVNALRPYLAATFKEVKFFLAGEKIEAVLSAGETGPDLVILEIVERGFGD